MRWAECGDGVVSRDGKVAGAFVRPKWDDEGRCFAVVERDDTGTIQAVQMSNLLPLERATGEEVGTIVQTLTGPAELFLR